jgi:hypothetical protein
MFSYHFMHSRSRRSASIIETDINGRKRLVRMLSPKASEEMVGAINAATAADAVQDVLAHYAKYGKAS